MKTGIKNILGAVLILAALLSAKGASAEVSIGTGLSGFMLRPVSVRWQEKAVQTKSIIAAVETSSVTVKAEEQTGQAQSDGGKQESAAAASAADVSSPAVSVVAAENKGKTEVISGSKASESKKV